MARSLPSPTPQSLSSTIVESLSDHRVVAPVVVDVAADVASPVNEILPQPFGGQFQFRRVDAPPLIVLALLPVELEFNGLCLAVAKAIRVNDNRPVRLLFADGANGQLRAFARFEQGRFHAQVHRRELVDLAGDPGVVGLDLLHIRPHPLQRFGRFNRRVRDVGSVGLVLDLQMHRLRHPAFAGFHHADRAGQSRLDGINLQRLIQRPDNRVSIVVKAPAQIGQLVAVDDRNDLIAAFFQNRFACPSRSLRFRPAGGT